MRTPHSIAHVALVLLSATGLVATSCANADRSNDTPNQNESEEVDSSDWVKGGNGKSDSSVEAVFLDFAFEGEVLTNGTYRQEERIEDQLLYTVGQLNGDNSVGRVDKLELSDIQVEEVEGANKISYSAEMLVAWGERDDVPDEYTFQLPRDMTREGKQSFVDSYGEDCVSFGADDIDANSMWYYYRPESYGCDLDGSDLVQATADISPSEVQTSGKYPEYHKIWEDDVLKVTAVFGKYKEGATKPSDAGIEAYNTFVDQMERTLGEGQLETTPSEVPDEPGVETPEVTFTAEYDDGRKVEVHAFLVDGVKSASQDFYDQYAELTRTSDLITYNGHSGLGSNIKAMARKGDWREGQYSIVFMNGCDTYAYVDSALADAHARVNPDDDTGTKYMDLVMNAMPSYFSNMAQSTTAIVRGLMRRDDPVNYEHIFENIDDSQVVLVSGEQDNEYVPGMQDDDGDGDNGEGDGDDSEVESWSGFEKSATVAGDEEQRFETPTVPAGKYRFDLSGSGDADLYVRAGEAPDTETYDCRPYKAGSDESCVVDIGSPTAIHVMVRGWADQSEVELVGAPADES